MTSANRPTKKKKINVTLLAREIQRAKGLPEPPVVTWNPGREIEVEADLTDAELTELLSAHGGSPVASLVDWKQRLYELVEKQEAEGLNEQERRERNDLLGKAFLTDMRGLLDEA